MSTSFTRIAAAAVLFLPLTAAALSCSQPSIPGTTVIDLTSEITSTTPSANIGIAYVIANNGAQPVEKAMLVFDVVRADDTDTSVSRFVAARDIDLAPGEKRAGNAVLRVPMNLPSGDYAIGATIVPHGIALPAALRGASAFRTSIPLHIDGGVASASFVAGSAQVAGVPYTSDDVAGISGGEDTPVQIAVRNPTDGPYIGTITWRLHRFDAVEGALPLSETTEKIALHPNASVPLSYVVPKEKDGAYVLEAEVSDGVSSSHRYVWLARDGVVPTGCTGGVSLFGMSILGIVAAAAVLFFVLAAHRSFKGEAPMSS